MTTEAHEVADSIIKNIEPKEQRAIANSFYKAAEYIRAQMPDETMTIIDNTAQALQQACRRANPDMVCGYVNWATFNVCVTFDNDRHLNAAYKKAAPFTPESAKAFCEPLVTLELPLEIDWSEVAEDFNYTE